MSFSPSSIRDMLLLVLSYALTDVKKDIAGTVQNTTPYSLHRSKERKADFKLQAREL